jgi:hypothetical protein
MVNKLLMSFSHLQPATTTAQSSSPTIAGRVVVVEDRDLNSARRGPRASKSGNSPKSLITRTEAERRPRVRPQLPFSV